VFDFLINLLDMVFSVFPWFKRKRERRKEWSGTVEEKKIRTLSRLAYLVIFRTDDGQRKKVRLDRKEDFDVYKIGQRYTKKAGRGLPDTKFMS
jgi:hypothetical protein